MIWPSDTTKIMGGERNHARQHCGGHRRITAAYLAAVVILSQPQMSQVDTVLLHSRKMQIPYKGTVIFRTKEMQISYNKISDLFSLETYNTSLLQSFSLESLSFLPNCLHGS